MTEELQKKVSASVKLLQAVQGNQLFADYPIELAYSGGKDSDVILHLARTNGINVQPIYKCTTVDPPGTIKHVLSVGATIRHPKRNFWKIVEAKGFPSRFERFCCSELKEFKISDTCIMGIRKDESTKRDKRYKEPIECRLYKNGGRVNAIYPILYWTEKDIEEYIKENNIQCAPVYYKNNVFDVKVRLGCIACPLQNRSSRIEEFRKYPGFVKQYIKHGQIYLDTHRHTKQGKEFANSYQLFILNVFCDNMEQYHEIIDNNDPKEFIENEFNIKL